MANNGGKLSALALAILSVGPVVPVVVLGKADQAAPLAKALLRGGIRVIEITLRSLAALEGIRRICAEVPEMIVGAGTVLNSDELHSVAQAGGKFAISPGLTPSLSAAACEGSIPLIPGVATPSELMLAQERGFTVLKFFPAEAAGGLRMLKALHGPFPKITFCPTGGISDRNYKDYLALPNVACVGGSWLAPPELLAQGDWEEIAKRAAQATAKR